VEAFTSISVQNYQSIGEASLDLGKLTVIVGRGNLGKSAFLRAFAACLFNETGTDFIKMGQKQCSVILHLAGEQTVTWIKDEKSARYAANVAGVPVNFTKLAGGVPTELQDVFGIRTIEIDKTFSIQPQIHGQHDPPLLLAESAGKAARALAKLTKLEIVVQAQMAAARDLRRSKQAITTHTHEADELTARLNTFPDMDKMEKRITRAQIALEGAGEALERLAIAEEAHALLLDAQRRLAVIPPSVSELDGLFLRLDKMQNSVLVSKVLRQAAEGVELTRQAKVKCNLVLQSAEADLDTFLTTLGTCPLCGQIIDKDHSDA